jgi:hypothetical protein
MIVSSLLSFEKSSLLLEMTDVVVAERPKQFQENSQRHTYGLTAFRASSN